MGKEGPGGQSPMKTVPVEAVASFFLHRQHLDRPLDRPFSEAALTRFVEDAGGLQIDSINVVDRAHYLTAWSRFAPTTRPCSTGSSSEARARRVLGARRLPRGRVALSAAAFARLAPGQIQGVVGLEADPPCPALSVADTGRPRRRHRQRPGPRRRHLARTAPRPRRRPDHCRAPGTPLWSFYPRENEATADNHGRASWDLAVSGGRHGRAQELRHSQSLGQTREPKPL